MKRSGLWALLAVLVPVVSYASTIHVPADQPTTQAAIIATSHSDKRVLAEVSHALPRYPMTPTLRSTSDEAFRPPSTAGFVTLELLDSYHGLDGAMDVCIWGDYLVVAAGSGGVALFDIGRPDTLVFVSELDGPGECTNVAVSNGHLFVANSEGLWIVDATNPFDIQQASNYAVGQGGVAIAVSQPYAYLATIFGLQILNVADPGIQLPVGYMGTNNPRSVSITGDTVFIGHVGGIQAIDVSNPANPTTRDNLSLPGHAQDILLLDSKAYLADGVGGLQGIDIANSDSLTTFLTAPTLHWAMRLDIQGTYAFVADYDSGLMVYDISDPLNPFVAGRFQTPHVAHGVAVRGNYAYIADHLGPPDSSSVLVLGLIFVRGDVNIDGVITAADIIRLVAYVFKGGPAPEPSPSAGDVNCDGTVNSADIIYLVNFVFKGGPEPLAGCSP